MVETPFFGIPSAPIDVSVKKSDGELVITWDRPESDGGLPLTGYIIMRGIEKQSLGRIASVGLVNSYSDHSPLEGDGFYYSIVAVNGKGEGLASDPVFIRSSDVDPGPDEISIWLILFVIVLIAIVLIGGIVLVMRKGPPTSPVSNQESDLPDDALAAEESQGGGGS